MQLADVARRVPPEVWAAFDPVLPPVRWCGNGRPPVSNERVLHALLYVLVSGIGWSMLPWPAFPSAKTVRRRLRRWAADDVFRATWARLTERYDALVGINWDQLCVDGAKRPSKKGASRRAPAPSTARQARGTNLSLVSDGQGMPLGIAVTAANRQDCSSMAPALAAMVIAPTDLRDVREPASMPTLRGDGGYGYRTTRADASALGYHLRAPSRGQPRMKGLGRVRVAVEHGHALLNQFGRVARRLDRSVAMFTMWTQLAACVIFIRAGFVP